MGTDIELSVSSITLPTVAGNSGFYFLKGEDDMGVANNIYVNTDTSRDPRKGLSLDSVTKILQAQDPDFFKNGIKNITWGSDPYTIHIRFNNGDEFDYTVEGIQTKLVKTKKEKQYRFADGDTRPSSRVIMHYCNNRVCGPNTCIFYRGTLLESNESKCESVYQDDDVSINKLLRFGIIEEVKQ